MADNLIDQELAKLIAEERLKDLKADAEDKAFRVKWNDKELEFRDPKQLEDALNNYSTDMQKMMEEERERVRAEVRAEFAKVSQAKTDTTKPSFNQDEFKELVEKGKVDEAISYAAKQGPLGQEVEQLRTIVAQQAAMSTAQNWLSMHPEIPRDAYGEVLQKLGTALDTNRVPLTPQNLELVYSYGKQNNVFNYGNSGKEADQVQTQTQRKAPPSVPRNGGAGASGGYTMDDLTELLMNAPDDKVDALYAKIRKSFV